MKNSSSGGWLPVNEIISAAVETSNFYNNKIISENVDKILQLADALRGMNRDEMFLTIENFAEINVGWKKLYS
jgi:hypothetical protein